ncbi:lysoplasmalogenase [Sabulilitoribacter arenilitoris]|uniref:Lysoplasmalogenase n=1 Tax=Wocania arenilitoris TaxID=2044858 RepID=A0AAE3JP12_9FLAO|nr:lysoplasmalogenase [Wocania arenilitoris]MCF7569241.1 lysoplasmalogenase [Wocania arenilitoris]
MLSKKEKIFALIFSIIVIAELICVSFKSLTTYHYFTKPLILLSLILFFLKYCKHLDAKTKWLTLLALTFSLFGDVLLMFDTISVTFLASGLVAFLIAHIMYILIFLKHKNNSKNIFYFSVFLLIYATTLFYFLKDGVGDLLLPVVVYMLVILLMAITAFYREGSVPKNSFILVFLGALFFITSDSLLALNKFYSPLPFSNISIMFTYSIAQLFIVFGIKKQF